MFPKEDLNASKIDKQIPTKIRGITEYLAQIVKVFYGDIISR